jgi:hypothetical protein
MITPDTRRNYLTNLDQPRDKRFAKRLAASNAIAQDTPHSYDRSEPRATTSRINTPAIVAGDLIQTSTSVEGDVQQTKIGVDYTGDGRHLRLNPQKDAVEAVDLVTDNQTEARIVNEFVDQAGQTVLRSKIRGLSTDQVVLANGTSLPVSGWFNSSSTPASVWTSFIADNFLNKQDAVGAINGLGEVGAWSPVYFGATDLTKQTTAFLPPEAYEEQIAGDNYGKPLNGGVYFKLGPLVFFWMRIITRSNLNNTAGNSIVVSQGFHDNVNYAYPSDWASQKLLYISGPPFAPDYTNQGRLHQFKYRFKLSSKYGYRVPNVGGIHTASYAEMDADGDMYILNETEVSYGQNQGYDSYTFGRTSQIVNHANNAIHGTDLILSGFYLTTDLDDVA